VPRYYGYNFETKKEKLAQYAERIWNIQEGSVDEKVELAIIRTKSFFHSLGIDAKFSEYTNDYQNAA